MAKEASIISSGAGLIESNQKSMDFYAMGLRLTVAFSVGLAIVIGVLRILKGWPLYYLIIGGYVLVMLMTIIAPEEIIGLAYDAGGVTTSTITVPLSYGFRSWTCYCDQRKKSFNGWFWSDCICFTFTNDFCDGIWIILVLRNSIGL